jgi:hypothetical protein
MRRDRGAFSERLPVSNGSWNGLTAGGQSGVLQIALQVALPATPPNCHYRAMCAANAEA